MSRQYMLGRWCVRCHRSGPTPYLKKNLTTLEQSRGRENLNVLDLGCGNGRNMDYLHEQGFGSVVGFDMVADAGHPFTLGQKPLPLYPSTVDIVLANYLFMFLDRKEREQLLLDIRRAARVDCTIMVELYPAKDSHTPNEQAMLDLQRELQETLGWDVLRSSKGRFIARRPTDAPRLT